MTKAKAGWWGCEILVDMIVKRHAKIVAGNSSVVFCGSAVHRGDFGDDFGSCFSD